MSSKKASKKPSPTSGGGSSNVLRELPMAKEADLLSSLNAPISSQKPYLKLQKPGQNKTRGGGNWSGLRNEGFISEEIRLLQEQLKGQDEGTRKARIKDLENHELTRLKNVVDRWELELQHSFNLYQDQMLRSILGQTKERIRVLEELELSGTNLALLQELRCRVDSLNQKGERAKHLIRKNFLGMERNLETPSLGERVENIKHAVQHPVESIQERFQFWERMEFYQEKVSNFISFFMVFFFANLTFQQKRDHLQNGLRSLWFDLIDRWRDQIERDDLEQEERKRKDKELAEYRGFFLHFLLTSAYFAFTFPFRMMRFFWFFGWLGYSWNLSKRFLVHSWDYFQNPYFSSPTVSLNDKVNRAVKEARFSLDQNVRSKIIQGTHYAMTPMEYATDNFIQNESVKEKLQKALETVDPLYSPGEEEISLNKKRSGSISGVETTNPIVGAR